MSNTVIDKKTETHKFGGWIASESVTTTISLVNMGDGKFGLSYDSKFSGVKDGHVQGGPFAVDGNKNIKVHSSPDVHLTISKFDKTSSTISMNVDITVDIPVLGTKTIFDQTLSGTYAAAAG